LYKLTETINDLLSRIEASMARQKQFTSDASHEMRTPLAAIRGTLEVLIRKQREPEVYTEKISGIIQQVDRLDALLEQLLHLARIESGASILKNETLALHPIISAQAEKWKESAALKKIQILVDISETAQVRGDRLYLELILDNLVNNAIKYGKEDGHVFLEWNASLRSLTVRDDGHGISADHLPNVFNRFYRADESRSSAVKGNGLGLSIVKKLADMQAITLVAESVEGEGSTFTLRFPA
jgi:signal transduction histidine kinase